MGKQHLSRDERLIRQDRLKGTQECMDKYAIKAKMFHAKYGYAITEISVKR
jgi:hypothetical protein